MLLDATPRGTNVSASQLIFWTMAISLCLAGPIVLMRWARAVGTARSCHLATNRPILEPEMIYQSIFPTDERLRKMANSTATFWFNILHPAAQQFPRWLPLIGALAKLEKLYNMLYNCIV